MDRFATACGVGAMLLCLLQQGCGWVATPIQSPPVTIRVERIVEQADLVVVRAHVTFRGEREVHLWQQSDSETFTIQPDAKTGFSECDVLLVADLVNAGDECHAKWLHSISHRGGSAGGPATHVVPEDAKLSDLLQIKLQSGDYEFGEEIEVATFRDQPLRLRVK